MKEDFMARPISSRQKRALLLMPCALYRTGDSWGLQTAELEPIIWRVHDRWPMVLRKLLKRGLIVRRPTSWYPDLESFDITEAGKRALDASWRCFLSREQQAGAGRQANPAGA
jgi:hypothetical protein